MREQNTWTDVHHFVCFDCHTEKTPLRQPPVCATCGKPIVFDVPRTMDHKCKPAAADEDALYEIAKQITLDEGLPYFDPRTGERTDPTPEWLRKFCEACAAEPQQIDAKQMAERISKALELAEVSKYATPESRFTFELSNATEEDLRVIREHLSPFENSIVVISLKI